MTCDAPLWLFQAAYAMYARAVREWLPSVGHSVPVNPQPVEGQRTCAQSGRLT